MLKQTKWAKFSGACVRVCKQWMLRASAPHVPLCCVGPHAILYLYL